MGSAKTSWVSFLYELQLAPEGAVASIFSHQLAGLRYHAPHVQIATLSPQEDRLGVCDVLHSPDVKVAVS